MSSRASTSSRVPWRGALLLVPVLIFVLVFLVASVAGSSSTSQDANPFASRAPFTSQGSAASAAAADAEGADREILSRIAGTPTAVWLTPEAYPSGKVGDVVDSVVTAAGKARKTPVLVVYGITDRDCSGGQSSGGLPPDQYESWVDEIADAASGAVVVLEPDALATAQECDQLDQRTTLLSQAVDTLSGAGTIVYVDAGHASWTSPSVMASMLRDVGVDKARGFSTNVSGYESAEDEKAYADAVSAATGNAHYVTDTGRNGAGSNGEWCNPQGRALGREPRAGSSGPLDAYLWIKPPGESDGTCGGAPEAGVFWPEQALELARNAGW